MRSVRSDVEKKFQPAPAPPVKTQKFENKGTRDETVPQPRCGVIGPDPEITEPNNPFSNQDLIGFDGADWVKAQASPDGTPAAAMVYEADDDSYKRAFHGKLKFPGHGLSRGYYYLDPDTAGAMTATLPGIGEKIQIVAFVEDSDHIFINPMGRATP